MINNEPLSQAHKPATPYKKQNQHKKWKRGMDNRKNGRGAQAICRNNTNHDGVSDISKSPDSNVVEVASNLVGNYVQATVKNGAQFQGKLSETSTITYDHLELILKDACKIRHGHKKNDLAFSARTETLTINHGDLKDIVLVKPMKWKNVFKVNQEIGDNGARQERHLQQWQPTTELLEETSLVDSELNHSDSSNSTSTDIASWTQFTSNDFKEGLNTAKLDQSTPDFKDCEQKAIVHGNEIQQSSSSNAHVLEERSCIITNKTWDEDDHYVAANKNSTNDINGNTSHRPYKSSMKTHNPRKLQHNYKYQSHQHWQSNVLDQKTNDMVGPNSGNHCFNDFSTTENEIRNANNAKSNITLHSNNYSNTGDHLQNNGRNTYWSTYNPKKNNRRNYQHRKWIKNDVKVSSNKTYNYQRNSDKNDNIAINNDTESTYANQSSKNKNESSALPHRPFQLNIMATEFVPFSGIHTLLRGEIKPKGTTSSVYPSFTPRTPPERKSELVLVNEMFTAPFIKQGHLAPDHIAPLWPYGDTPYRNHSDFSLVDIDWLMDQYQNLHHILYGYHPFTLSPYPALPYVPHYPHQQYRRNPRNRPTRM